MSKKKTAPHEVARKLFEDATQTGFTSAFNQIMSLQLKQKFGKDPYEVLVDDPKTFYNSLKEVLGEDGTATVINTVGTFLEQRYSVNFAAEEEFLEFFVKGDDSSKRRLQEILASIASIQLASNLY